jgi:pimeloyl-ACP methyl ester carboxylesterase
MRLTMVAEYGMERFIAHLRACMQRPARDDVWRSALNPLLVAGSHDRLLKPQTLRELAASRPGCAFHLIDGAGHLVPLEQPQALADIVVPWVRGSS